LLERAAIKASREGSCLFGMDLGTVFSRFLSDAMGRSSCSDMIETEIAPLIVHGEFTFHCPISKSAEDSISIEKTLYFKILSPAVVGAALS
jgi:hypothetical protein